MTREILFSGVVSGICASVLYSIAILLIRVLFFAPKILISEEVLKKTETSEERTSEYLSVKVVNKSRSNAVNIDYALYYCEKHKNGVNNIIDLKTRRDKFPVLDNYCRKNTDYATRFSFYIPENFDMSKENVELLFKIVVTQSFSNRTKCFVKRYTKNELREKGFFETGKSLIITDC